MKINNELSLKDTTVIKGIGILLIVCHNFLHWIKPMLGENEFSFIPKFAQNFIDGLGSNPGNFLQYLVAFAGHYGIHLFVFISGYGLTKRYINSDVCYLDFIKKRITKLYPVFAIALFALFLYNYLIFKMEFNSDVAIDFLTRFTLVANLIPKEVFVLNGPFWFYSMIVQLYLLFPLLLILQKKNAYLLYLISLVFFVLISNYQN
ncbi:MAG: acyltransferase family protein [Lacinutrix sp.]|uniref:acyltransferase family protein n=1 Tax=Lacinutrix sp. TaxID=1937692 RepID=UPI0030972A64